jgi:rhomboid protease GluP
MPQYKETVVLENISAARYLSMASKAITALGWKIVSGTTTEMTAEAPASFSKNTWGELITIYALNNTAELIIKSKGTTLFDWGRNKKNIARFRASLAELQQQLPAEDPPVEEMPAAGAEQPEGPQYVFGRPAAPKSFLHIFIPRGDFFITPVIIELNIIVYIIMVASGVNFFAPEGQDLIAWGGNFKPLVLAGEWWRLFSCMFLHFGILHLALNMYALFFIGVYLEPLLGRVKFATAYLAAGLLSSVASTWWHGNDIVGAGASGAIFGMYGVFLALLTTNIVDKHARQSLLSSVGIFVAYNLFYGLSHKEIDNSAHIGGLLSGMVIGYILYFGFREPSEKKNKVITIIIAAVALLITFLYTGAAHDDSVRFQQKYEAFIDLQNKALAPLQSDSFPSPGLLRDLRETSLPAWKKAQQVIDSTNAFRLDTVFMRKRQLAAQYAQLRIRQTELFLETFGTTGDADRNKTQIEALAEKIDALVEEMNK